MNGKTEDKVLAELASLYERRGYMRYRPGCFEEYSLYLDNIDFLISKTSSLSAVPREDCWRFARI